MIEQEVFVYIDLEGTPILVGRLWARVRGKKESATFEYDDSWLARTDKFSLEPALMLTPGTFHTDVGHPIFGSLGDSAPDRWGRALMRRAERLRAVEAGETPKTLFELDYLLRVSDLTRQGALRLSQRPGGVFLANHDGVQIPPLIDLPKLLSAADHIATESESANDLRLLLAPGSSLGGARPKASVLDSNGKLLIAKFPHKNDEIDTVRWEAVALKLASLSGIAVSNWRIEIVSQSPVLLLERFDRVGRRSERRIPFLSALSMLSARDNETRSYLEIADALKMHGAAPKIDLKNLYKRLIFNILISNTDDHLRNHAFIYQDLDGWRLSPAYDLNPVPIDIRPRILSTNINETEGDASLDLAYDVSGQFELKRDEARKIALDISKAVSQWKKVAEALGLSKAAIKRMASAFEHDD